MKNYAAISEEYIGRVTSGEELVCRKVRQTIERHLRDLARVDDPDFPYFYDTTDAVKVCRLFELVRPSKWPTTMKMAPWMVACTLLLYGWKTKAKEYVGDDDNGEATYINPRRFRRAFLMWPRKMGKSAYLSVLCINALILDGERGAEVYSAGIVEKQARRVFDEAVAMRDSTPLLRDSMTKAGDNPCRSMSNPAMPNSEFRPLSRDKDAVQGTNPSFAACDEVHVWRGRGVYDDIRWGMRARIQPLLVAITTAPSSDDTTGICSTLYEFARKVLDGVLNDDSFFCWVTELDGEIKNALGEVVQEADRWDDETKWVKACPNLGITVKLADMRQEALEAANDGESLIAFKRYSLNVQVNSGEQAIQPEDWNACARAGDPIKLRAETLEKMRGRICFAGLDLALTDDTSGLGLWFPPMEDNEPWRLVPFFWIPADNIRERVEKHQVPYDAWRDQGFLTATPGKVTDHGFIVGQIQRLAKEYDLRELAYDPALASGLIKKLLDGGFKKDRVVKYAQTLLNYASPCGDFVRGIARREIEHDGDPVLRWQISNLRWYRNHTGLIMPDKQQSIEKIDGVAASIMGFGRASHPDNAKLLKKPKVTLL